MHDELPYKVKPHLRNTTYLEFQVIGPFKDEPIKGCPVYLEPEPAHWLADLLNEAYCQGIEDEWSA